MVLLIFSLSVFGWEYHHDTGPRISNSAREIAYEITLLPDPLYVTSQDAEKVRQLMNAVISDQDMHSNKLSTSIALYHDSNGNKEWNNAEFHYHTLSSLSDSKQALLDLSTNETRDQLTGFGPKGVTQFRKELQLIKLKTEYLALFQVRSFHSFVRDIYISPVPVISTAVKVILVYLVLTWWLANNKRLINKFKQSKIENSTQPPMWAKVAWYVFKANVAIAWLIAITVTLQIVSALPSLQHLVFLEIFTWWVLGGSIAISLILEFVARHSKTSNQKIIALRLSTVRRYVWSIICAGVVLQISMRILGKGTIYYWISSTFTIWFALITVLTLRNWRPVVFASAEKIVEKPPVVTWSIQKKDAFVLGLIATVIVIGWLISHRAKSAVVSVLSRYKIFGQVLAYLFRIEIAKQNNNSDANKNLVRVRGNEAFEYVLPGSEDSKITDYGASEIKQLSKFVLTDSPAVCVISGERGIGTTTFLRQILHKLKNGTPIYINCPYAGYTALLQQLSPSLGLDEDASEIQILTALRKSNTNYLITVDNAQRLVKPMVGGLSELIRFTNLLRRSKKNHRALLAIEKSSWRFVDRARGERLLFDWVAFLPRWSELQVSELLTSRINQSRHISFEGLTVPKQWDHEDMSEDERAKRGFFRVLWHYSDGNPTVALRFFRFSLNRNKETEQVVVRLFHAPSSQELEKMPKPMLAVLRSIVQLEVASPEELSDCTQLSIAEVTGTLRYFQSRGFIEWSEEKARVSDHWFRHITNVLHRQHLLVK
ncbi:ATP-binding protein [Vibrio sp. HN007]